MTLLGGVPVFRKDLSILLRMLPWFFAIQVVWAGGLVLVFRIRGWPDAYTSAAWMMLMMGWILGQGFSLFAAAHYRAEEREHRTDAFLGRLPASRARIGTEKVAAALVALAVFWSGQGLFHLLSLPFGGIWPPPQGAGEAFASGWPWTSSGAIAVFLVLVYLSSYVTGLLASALLRQTLVIVFVAFAAWWAVASVFMIGLSAVPWDLVTINLVVYAPLVAVLTIMALPGRRIPWIRVSTNASPSRRPWLRLAWKGVVENILLQALCFAFLVAAWASTSPDPWLFLAGGLILLAALGTASYPWVEKRGLDCVLYHHPIPRNTLFWSKIVASAPAFLAVVAGVFLLWNRGGEPPVPVTTVLLLGAFAYLCAVLVSLTLERQLTALLATVTLTHTTLVMPFLILELLAPGALGAPFTELPPVDAATAQLRLATVPLALLAVGCLLASRHMATDKSVRTGSARDRGRRFARVYSVVVAVAVLVSVAGWDAMVGLIMGG